MFPWTDNLKRFRVLIADPDEGLLAEYRKRLSHEFALLTAADGMECAARLCEQPPDVLVLEPQLPCGGGRGVLALIHSLPRLAAVPVMILTSCREVGVLKSVAPFWICDYIVKPIAPAQLATRIRRLLELRQLRVSALDGVFAVIPEAGLEEWIHG